MYTYYTTIAYVIMQCVDLSVLHNAKRGWFNDFLTSNFTWQAYLR